MNGSELIIHIKPSDDSLGTFSFNVSQLKVSEGSKITMLVQRKGGSLDSVNVKWRINDAMDEFKPSFGVVVVPYAIMKKTFTFVVIDDQVLVVFH